jgi:hypothetical protein
VFSVAGFRPPEESFQHFQQLFQHVMSTGRLFTAEAFGMIKICLLLQIIRKTRLRAVDRLLEK